MYLIHFLLNETIIAPDIPRIRAISYNVFGCEPSNVISNSKIKKLCDITIAITRPPFPNSSAQF
jgi:hypothetical protein